MSLTLRSLPRRGNTPKRSRPTTFKPEMADVAAESPSVRISVQSDDLADPAQSASSSLGKPRSVLRFVPSVFLASLASLAASAACASSRSPIFISASATLADLNTLPNLAAGVVRVSLVCESKLGFTIVELTKKTTASRICAGLTGTFFFVAASQKSPRMWRTTVSTCLPPFLVLMPLTKETERAPSSAEAPAPAPAALSSSYNDLVRTAATSQRSPHVS